MRVLFVTLYALEKNSSVTKSNQGLLAGLAQLGASVDILMPDLDPSLKYFDRSFDLTPYHVVRLNENNLMNAVVSSQAKSTGLKSKIFGIVRQVYNKIHIIDRGKKYIEKIGNLEVYGNYYDYVISTSDPKSSHVLTGELIKKGLKYGSWIQHWGDPLAYDITKNTIYPNWIIKRKECQIISKADKVVYVSPFTLEIQQKIYPDFADKMLFVPLPCDSNYLKSEDENPYNRFIGERKLKLCYLGDYTSRVRNIMPLYNVVKKLGFCELTIAGSTDIDLPVQNNITVYPRVTQNKVREIENNSDVIISIGNISGSQIPGKIYYTASSDKIILITVDGDNKTEMKEYIDSYNRYVCCFNNENDITYNLNYIREHFDEITAYTSKTPEQLQPENVARRVLGFGEANLFGGKEFD